MRIFTIPRRSTLTSSILRLSKRQRWFVAAIILVVAVVSSGVFMNVRQTGAVGTTYFRDQAPGCDISGCGILGAYLFVGANYGGVNATAYYTSNSGQLRIHVSPDFPATCSSPFPFTINGVVTTAVSSSVLGCGRDWIVNLTNLPYDPDTQLYTAQFIATTLYNPNQPFEFKLQQTSANAFVIAQNGGRNGAALGGDVTVRQDRNTTLLSEFMDYYIVFGPDCSVKSRTPARVSYFDIDNLGNAAPQLGGKLTMQLYDITTGRPGTLLSTWTPPDQDNVVGDHPIPGGVEPGHKYMWVFRHVNYHNRIQFSTPYDGIFGVKSCPATTPYSLAPSIALSVAPNATVNPTSLLDVTANVGMTGGPSQSAEWQLSKIIVAPGGSIPSVLTDSPQPPNPHFGNTWSLITSGNTIFTLSPTEIHKLSNTEVDDRPAGTRICWALSLKPPSDVYVHWRHSPPVCVKIGKSPKINVLGGDVRVRGLVGTSTAVLGRGGPPTVPTTFGSWVEFGVFSIGTNTGFASGAGLRGGDLSSDQDDWSKLTFANVDTTGLAAFGNFTGLPAAPEIAEYFEGRVKSGVTLGALTNATTSNVYGVTSDLTIDTANLVIPKGRSIVIVASGRTVTINRNITYENAAMSSLDDIPQLVIVAARVIIDPAVTNVDAWLLASEWINTCGAVTTPNLSNPQLTVGMCGDLLTINGPVATGKLYLYRTAGSGPGADAETPAEKLNFRPDATLWAYNYGLEPTLPQISSIKGLPPRF